jgi:DNA-binding XRE family transcriptional regulator
VSLTGPVDWRGFLFAEIGLLANTKTRTAANRSLRLYPEEYSTRNTNQSSLTLRADQSAATGKTVISGAQIRAARALLRWTSRELAKKASLSIFTIEAIEKDDDDTSHPDTPAIQIALEAGGVEFINSVGVLMRPQRQERKNLLGVAPPTVP